MEKDINVIKKVAQEMAFLHEDKHSLVYSLYKQGFVDEINKLSIDEMVNCYAEIEVINKDAAALILHNILLKMNDMSKEELESLYEFVTQKSEALGEYEINLWTKIEPQIMNEVNARRQFFPAKKKIEIADRYNEIYKEKSINNNLNLAYYKIKKYCEDLKEKEDRNSKSHK